MKVRYEIYFLGFGEGFVANDYEKLIWSTADKQIAEQIAKFIMSIGKWPDDAPDNVCYIEVRVETVKFDKEGNSENVKTIFSEYLNKNKTED